MDFYRYFTKRRIYRWGMLITAILAILIAVVSYFGQNSGNFVMSVDDEAYLRGITLSIDPEFRTQSARLVASPVDDARDMSYDFLDISAVKGTNGDYRDNVHRYFAFSFYIKNTGQEAANIVGNLDIVNETLGVGDAIRVLIIEDNTTETIYMRQDTIDYNYRQEALKNAILFESDSRVCQLEINNLRPNQSKRYSVIMWLEGDDPDCIDKIKDGRIKMQLIFVIASSQEEN